MSTRARVAAPLSFLSFLLSLLACHATSTPGEPQTLRALYGLAPPARIEPPRTALVFVDFQEEFFHGRLPVEHGAAAVERAAALLGWARASGLLVVHVRNVALREDSAVFAASSPTTAFVPRLQPAPEELVLTKHQAGAFSRTDLDERLRARGIGTVVVAGIMTHLAVDTTARDASVLGYQVIVASDACATRALPSPTGGPVVDAATLHRVALASLADRFADVLRVDEITRISADAAPARRTK